MADWWVKTGSFNTPASGTTVVSTTAKGTNPKAIIFWSSDATSDDANNSHMSSCIGFATDTQEQSILANREKDSATENSFRSGSTSISLRILDPTDDSVSVAGTVAMNTNDVTITYSTFTANHRIMYMIFGGVDCDAFVGNAGADSSPVTGVGFQSTLVCWATHGTGAGATSEHSYQSFGFAHDNGSAIEQWGIFSYAGDNSATNSGSILLEADSLGQIDLDFTAWKADITVIGTDGFTWAGTNTDDFMYLCLNFDDSPTTGVHIDTFTKPTGAAPVTGALPDLGFTPQAYILGSANEVNQTDGVANDCEIFWGAYDGTDAQTQMNTAQNSDGNDAECRFVTGEVMALSTSLLDNNVQASATPQAITDSTPDIEWNPNTGNATIIGVVAFEVQANLAYDQDGFQFINDDGSESTATDLAAEDTNISRDRELNTRLRIQIDTTNADPPTEQTALQYKEVGDPADEWRDVPLT